VARLICAGIERVAQAVASRLKDSTAKKIAKPGQKAIHGAWAMKRWAVFSMLPTTARAAAAEAEEGQAASR